jgi:hypothetical protein
MRLSALIVQHSGRYLTCWKLSPDVMVMPLAAKRRMEPQIANILAIHWPHEQRQNG